ncbi:iron transporter [Halostella litorea]|uniref:iron transporter n=1 Tax=Halostella litorea TaxID=2528831 RepID=UPI001F27B880|nr:iron transporter [Halostella litorea]
MRKESTRRSFLAAGGVALATAIAGCASEDDADPGTNRTTEPTSSTATSTRTTTETTEEAPGRDLPNVARDDRVVYVPAHRDGMRMAGTADAGPYRVMMSYTLLHDFWVLTGQEVSYVRIENGRGMHLMASVWDPEYGQVIPLGSPPVEVRDAASGDVVTEKSLWPMLSQQMGPHFGDNVAFPGEGEYAVRLTLDPVSARQLGDYSGRFTESVTAEFDLPFRYDIMNNIREQFLEESGQQGALEPMETMGRPTGALPEPAALPGRHGGVVRSGDATFAVQVLEPSPAGVDSAAPYLAVSARTPYNRYPLPFMGLRATVTDGSETRFRDTLPAGIHPELGYHYGAAVPDIAMGDDVTLEVGAPPQVARHRGYQTAFMEFEAMTLTLGDGK